MNYYSSPFKVEIIFPLTVSTKGQKMFVHDYNDIAMDEVDKFLVDFSFKLRLHCAIYRPDSFVLTIRHCVNLKAIRYESTSSQPINRIV